MEIPSVFISDFKRIREKALLLHGGLIAAVVSGLLFLPGHLGFLRACVLGGGGAWLYLLIRRWYLRQYWDLIFRLQVNQPQVDWRPTELPVFDRTTLRDLELVRSIRWVETETEIATHAHGRGELRLAHLSVGVWRGNVVGLSSLFGRFSPALDHPTPFINEVTVFPLNPAIKTWQNLGIAATIGAVPLAPFVLFPLLSNKPWDGLAIALSLALVWLPCTAVAGYCLRFVTFLQTSDANEGERSDWEGDRYPGWAEAFSRFPRDVQEYFSHVRVISYEKPGDPGRIANLIAFHRTLMANPHVSKVTITQADRQVFIKIKPVRFIYALSPTQYFDPSIERVKLTAATQFFSWVHRCFGDLP